MVSLGSLSSTIATAKVDGFAAGDIEELARKALQSNATRLGLSDPTTQLKKIKVETEPPGLVHVESSLSVPRYSLLA
jgi:hypothetical protein